MKVSKFTAVLTAAMCAFIAGSSIYAVYRYSATDTGLIGTTGDQLSYDSNNPNVNVMLARPTNWHKIASEALLTHEDFAAIDGSTATIPITAELARQFCDATDDHLDSTLYTGLFIKHNTTGNAYDNLIGRGNNSIRWSVGSDIIISEKPVSLVFATPPSEEEYSDAEKAGVELEVEPVALDGFVFITHKDNPVDSLTVDQIRDIYSGRITNWKEVGGKDEKIRAFQRTKNSGSQTAMEELVMKNTPMTDPPVAFVAEEMGALVERIAEYENESAAIGYTYYYYINNLYKNPDIKVINIDGISPADENLLSNEYPFTAAYYAVIRSDEPKDSIYRELRDYMLTDEGQEIIRLAGYCPVKEVE